MASGATSRAISGMISGFGLARAKIIGRFAMRFTISGFKTFGPERPRNKSAPSITSSKVRLSVFGHRRLFAGSYLWCALRKRRHAHRTAIHFHGANPFQQHIQACNPRSPAAGGHNLDIFNLFVRNQQGVFRSRPHNNRGSVLIIVKHRDIHAFTAQFFNDKTIRRFDIL